MQKWGRGGSSYPHAGLMLLCMYVNMGAWSLYCTIVSLLTVVSWQLGVADTDRMYSIVGNSSAAKPSDQNPGKHAYVIVVKLACEVK